ncbi:MAG: 4-hydroxythreonine-4-phosphate dehydrogenase PdxA [Chitinophagaceae bacterium]|nr:4-hydroxythreonine-4-phosphate dehydrogenase PdxA [Chitinophagaceae bacterium]
MINNPSKPIIGITCGDLNGIGPEIIIKSLSDHRILDFCTPVVFSSNKVFNFYKKSIPEVNFNYQIIRDFNRLNTKQINIFNCWEEEVAITPGELNETGGKYAVISLKRAVQALKQGQIHGLVTAPVHKKNIRSNDFDFTGHTPFLQHFFEMKDVVMMMCDQHFRVALVTEHVPLSDVAAQITKEKILSKLNIIQNSLLRDFGTEKPKIAVLGLNPHVGDEGCIGNEEEEIIKPAIREAKNQQMLVSGPFSADAFFARRAYERYDAVLAMYHDQGLIPFKALSSESAYHFTAGLTVVRTSPAHGVAFDIAGKNRADHSSFLAALFACIDILKQRKFYDESRQNPLKKMKESLLAGASDEAIEE